MLIIAVDSKTIEGATATAAASMTSLEAQFKAVSLPPQLWAEAAEKICNDVLDISSLVQFALRNDSDEDDDDDEDGDCEGLNRLRCPSLYNLHVADDVKANSCVFLIDHMWTTTFPQAKRDLRSQPQLLDRLATILKVDCGEEQESAVSAIFSKIWPRLLALAGRADEYTVWYCLDEVGTSIQHSANPTFRLCPISIPSPSGHPYSLTLAWPIRDMEAGESVTRDFLPSVAARSSPTRELRLLAFWDTNYLREHAEDDPLLLRVLGPVADADEQLTTAAEAAETDFCIAQRREAGDRFAAMEERLLSLPRPLRIYCDRPDHLRCELLLSAENTITIVGSADEADALYLIDHTLDEETGEEISRKGKVLNQFWWEGMLVSKEHLQSTVRHSYSARPPWYPESYDLSSAPQLRDFVRSSLRGDGTWILKRYRGRHSIDYPISTSLSCALRHMESCPRVAASYVSPCLLAGRKFDIRFYVTVHSLEPLCLYRYETFSVRAANEPYNPKDLESYQSNFTVMSFLDDDSRIAQIRGQGCRNDPSMETFIADFEGQQGDGSWSRVQQLADEALRGVFLAAQRGCARESLSHPSGLARALHPNSCWSFLQPNESPAKAMYGVDVIISDQLQPMVLEVQYGPDCDRVLRHRPGFWGAVLGNLFLRDEAGFVRLA